MKISIITVCKNAAPVIETTLATVAAQSYADVEHVVIDGASTDATPAIVGKYRHSVRRFVSEPDTGIYNAMNKGIRQANGDYILFLNSGDYLVDNDVISDVAKYLEQHPRVDFLYGQIVVRIGDGPDQVVAPPEPAGALREMICGCLPHQATFARAALFERIGAFDERYRIHGDYDWFLRALTAPDVNVAYYPRKISHFDLGGVSSNLAVGQHEAYAIQNGLPLFQQEYWLKERLVAFQQRVLELRIQAADAEREKARLRADLVDTQRRLEEAEVALRSWQASRFFRLRTMWGRVKRALRRPHRLLGERGASAP